MEEMERAGISRGEVVVCLLHGALEISQIIGSEKRYGKKLELKDKTIIVIYTLRNGEERIITAYVVRRKKWQT